MRFVTIRHDGNMHPGVLADDDVVLLSGVFRDLVALIEAGQEGLARAGEMVGNASAQRVPLSEADLGPPITRFRRDVLCTGWNYWDHFEEGRGKREGQEVDRPIAPTFFTKSPDVVIGPRDDIEYDPRISAKWDYEAEVALVVGRQGRSVPSTRALDHVFGYCLANDVSQRDLQRRHGGQWLKGKSIDRTMPLGPMLVTPDELDVPNLRIECVLNGDVMQSATVSQMAFPIPELIAELSFGMTLRPGDVLLTGTPSGVGNARTPPVFLKDNDELVVRGSGLGDLRNRVCRCDLYEGATIELVK